MRLAVVVTYFPSVSQTFVLSQITGLLARGHEVDIFAVAREPLPNGTVRADTGCGHLVERTRYQPRTSESALMRAIGVPALVAREWRGHVRAAARAAARGAHHRVAVLYEGAPFAQRHAYDALLCHFGPNGERALRVRDAGIVCGPVVTAFHGADMSRYVSMQGAGVYRDLFARGDLFLPVSDAWRRRLIELGCPADKIEVHRMGIALDEFPYGPLRMPTADEPVRLLSIARLVEKKGIEFAIRAVAQLRGNGVDVVLDVIGDGPLRSSLLRLVRELGMSNAVRIVGAGTREEVARSMRAAHLVVAPSVTADDGDMEGIPVALMEAMASGVPVVATRHSGIPELVCHGVSGVLVPERDVKALAAAIQQLVERPQQWLALTRAARQTVEQLHDVEVLNDRLVELLAGQRPTSRRQRVVHSRSTMASGSSVESPPKPHQFPFEPR